MLLRSEKVQCKSATPVLTPLSETTSAWNWEFFPQEDHRGQQKPGGAQTGLCRQVPESGQWSDVIPIHRAIPPQSRRDLVLGDSPQPARGRVKTVARPLLGPSFYQVAGLGRMRVLDQTTSLGRPRPHLTPLYYDYHCTRRPGGLQAF